MNIPKITEAVGNIDDKYLKEAELPARRHFRFKPTLLAAIIGIIALSTGAAAVSYTDYSAVYQKAAQLLNSCFNPQDYAKTDEEIPPNDNSNDNDNSCDNDNNAVAVSYISCTSGLEKMKYVFERNSGFATESPFEEEETHPDFTDLTTKTIRSSGDYDYFYREFGEKIPNPEEFPWLESLEGYGVEIENEGEFVTGDFRVTSVMCDDHYFCAVLQYALPEHVKKALKDIPDDTYLSFYNCTIIPSGGYLGVSPISLEGDVFTFMLSSSGYESYPDAFEISISGFGYRNFSNWPDYTQLCEAKTNITVPSDKLKKMDNRISNSVKYPTEYGDVDISAQLSPFGIMYRFTSENKKAAEFLYFDRSNKSFGFSNLRIHLEDGRIYGSGKTYFALHYILSGYSGFVENYDDIDPTNDIYYISIPFASAVDIDKIEKLSIDGCEFVFE